LALNCALLLTRERLFVAAFLVRLTARGVPS